MHRRAYVVLFIAVFVSTLGVGFIGPLLPLYARDLGAHGLALGMIFAGFSAARFFVTPVFGRLSDHWGRRRFLATGLALYAVASLAYLAAKTTGQLIVVRSLHGATGGMVIPIAQAYIGDMSPEGREGSYMGAFMVSLFTAFGIGPLLGGPLADRFGMSAPFYVMGLLSAIACLLTIVMLPELGLHHERAKKRAPVSAIIKEPLVVAFFLFRSISAFGRGLIVPFLPFVAESRGASLSMIGLLLATYIILAGLLQIPFGRLADRMSKPLLMSISVLGSAGVLVAIPFCRTVESLFALQIAAGVASAVGFPAGLAVATRCGRRFHAMGTSMGLFNTGMSVGLIVGPLAGGFAEGIFGLDFVFQGGSLVVVAGFIVFLLAMRKAERAGSLAWLGDGGR